MAIFSIDSAVNNAGLPRDEFDIVFICWKTPKESMDFLKQNNYKYVDIGYDEGKGFLWNLYRGWNAGYTEGFKYSDLVVPIATDHAFYKNWLKNMVKWSKPNRVVNCKLIEPGILPTIHLSFNLGRPTYNEFNNTLFHELCGHLYKEELATDEVAYGRRFDAMPFSMPRDVWERFGPMRQDLNDRGITGDTDFFDRMRSGGVEIVKALDSISYHWGAGESTENKKEGVYS